MIGTTVASAALVLAACGSSTPSGGGSTTTTPAGHGMVKVKGGTLTIAESPAAGPNYIFPMMGSAYFTTQNYQLIYLLYRPLYWFGVGNTPSLNEALSFGELPVYSNGGRVVTIKMKGWKWSNGETVDAQDIVFWMNLLKADATSWAAYVPGPTQFPGNVTNIVTNSSTDTVTFTLDAAYSQLWFTNNELSQITPLPTAWDITSAGGAAGSGGCSKATYASITTAFKTVKGQPTLVQTSASARACAKVYAFLTGETEAGDLGTYASNPLWQIVNGPFKLTQYDATDNGATLVPNNSYSGLPKPTIDRLVLAPFTTDTAEFNVLSGRGQDQHRVRPVSGRSALQGQDLRPGRSDRWAQQRAARGKLQPRTAVRLGNQLLRHELHQPDLWPDLLPAVCPAGVAVADEPDPMGPAFLLRLCRADLWSGARGSGDRPRYQAGEHEPVPL